MGSDNVGYVSWCVLQWGLGSIGGFRRGLCQSVGSEGCELHLVGSELRVMKPFEKKKIRRHEVFSHLSGRE